MTLESMINKLSPLEVYDLGEDSMVYAELAAFSVALDVQRNMISCLLREGFISTAESFGIETEEKLSGAVRDDLPLEKRRGMLIERRSLSVHDFTLRGLEKILSFMGVEGGILEYPQMQRICLDLRGKDYDDAKKEWIVSQAQELLPAHLEQDVVFSGFCWADSDDNGLSFAYMDSKGYTWLDIDSFVQKGE